jgi:hypothetical protein
MVASAQMTSRMVPKVAPGPGVCAVRLDALVEAAVPALMMMFRMMPTATDTRVHQPGSRRRPRQPSLR